MGTRVVCSACGTVLSPPANSQETTMICPACDSDVVLNFATDALDFVEDSLSYCPNCKAAIKSDDLVCVSCGTNLRTGEIMVGDIVAAHKSRPSSSDSSGVTKIALGAAIILLVVGLGGWLLFKSFWAPPAVWYNLIPKECWLVISLDPQHMFDLPLDVQKCRKLQSKFNRALDASNQKLDKQTKRIFLFLAGSLHDLDIGIVIKGTFSSKAFKYILKNNRTVGRHHRYPLVRANLKALNAPIWAQLGPCLLKKIISRSSLDDVLTLIDEKTLIIGKSGTVCKMIDCYRGDLPTLAENPAMACWTEETPPAGKILAMRCYPPAAVLSRLHQHFSESFDQLLNPAAKQHFMQCQRWDVSVQQTDPYNVSMRLLFARQEAASAIANILQTRLVAVSQELQKFGLAEHRYYQYLQIKPQKVSINFSLQLPRAQSAAFYTTLCKYTTVEGMNALRLSFRAAAEWQRIQSLPAEELGQIQDKLEAYRQFMQNFATTSLMRTVRQAWKKLKQKEKLYLARQTLEDFSRSLERKSLFEQWQAWGQFIVKHTHSPCRDDAQQCREAVLDKLYQQVHQGYVQAQELYRANHYTKLQHLPVVTKYLQQSKLVRLLSNASQKLGQEFNALRSLVRQAQQAINAQQQAQQAKRRQELERLMTQFNKEFDYFRRLARQRQYSQAQQWLRGYQNKLKALGSIGTNSKLYPTLSQRLADIERISSIWEKAKQGFLKNKHKRLVIKLIRGNSITGWPDRVVGDRLYIRMRYGSTARNLKKDIHLSTVIELAQSVDSSSAMIAAIATLLILEQQWDLLINFMEQQIAKQPGTKQAQAWQQLIDKVRATQQKKRQLREVQQALAVLKPLALKAFHERNADRALRYLKQLKEKVSSHKYSHLNSNEQLMLYVALKLYQDDPQHLLGKLTNSLMTTCRYCHGKGQLLCPQCRGKKKDCPLCKGKHKLIGCKYCFRRRYAPYNVELLQYYQKIDVAVKKLAKRQQH